jgi:hypothetical protein
MANIPFEKDINPNPLVSALIEKTKEGKLKWQPTSLEDTFIVSIGGGSTLRISLVQEWTTDDYGNEVQITNPRLVLLTEKGTTLWTINDSDVVGTELWTVFKLARRIANKVDEKLATVMGYLENL